MSSKRTSRQRFYAAVYLNTKRERITNAIPSSGNGLSGTPSMFIHGPFEKAVCSWLPFPSRYLPAGA